MAESSFGPHSGKLQLPLWLQLAASNCCGDCSDSRLNKSGIWSRMDARWWLCLTSWFRNVCKTMSYSVVPCMLVRVASIWLSRFWSIVENGIGLGMAQIACRHFIYIIYVAYTYLHVSDTTMDVLRSVRTHLQANVFSRVLRHSQTCAHRHSKFWQSL